AGGTEQQKSAIAGNIPAAAARGAMIDLHYAPTPNGWKISIMLEELGLPYQVIPVNIRAGEQLGRNFWRSARTTGFRRSWTMNPPTVARRFRCSKPGRS